MSLFGFGCPLANFCRQIRRECCLLQHEWRRLCCCPKIHSMAGANSKWEFASLSWIVVGDFQKLPIKVVGSEFIHVLVVTRLKTRNWAPQPDYDLRCPIEPFTPSWQFESRLLPIPSQKLAGLFMLVSILNIYNIKSYLWHLFF